MKHYRDEMPLYAAGQMSLAEAARLEQHLAGCPDCQAELAFWQGVASEIHAADATLTAPADLAGRALERIQAGAPRPAPARFKLACRSVFSLLRAQVYLIRREMWPAATGIMALGVIVALISNHIEAISFLAPLVAAASLAALYGPEYDPAHELTLATPTSPWKILLARLGVVSAFNLLLALLAGLAMLLIVPPDVLGILILGWLAPMAFLSALALLLSIWMGANRAILIAYSLWVLQYMQISRLIGGWGISSGWDTFLATYRQFWQSPGLLLILSATLLVVALLSTRYSEPDLTQSAA